MSVPLVLVLCLVLFSCTDFSEAQCDYKITTVTGERNHGKDPYDVKLRLYEENGNEETQWMILDNTDSKLFRRGSKNTFWFDAVCLSSPCIQLQMRNGNFSWYAGSLKIVVPEVRQSTIDNHFDFTINTWINVRRVYESCESVKNAYFSFGKV